MSKFMQKSMRQILDLAASAAPTPGGGSVAAMVACLGLSMAAMVGNLTLGKKNYLAVQAEVEDIITSVGDLSSQSELLLQEDMDVFARYIAALSLPKNTPEEQNFRSGVMEENLRIATETPLNIARVCAEGLDLTLRITTIGNKSALSDAGVAALTLEAALNGALLNVEANAKIIKDQNYAAKAKEESKSLQTRATAAKVKILEVMRARM